MNKRRWILGLLSAMALMVLVSPSEANFVQCPAAGGVCGNAQGTTNEADIINGSPQNDNITAQNGNDIVFGNDGNDSINGGGGNDVLFGGLGIDFLTGGPGSNIYLPGPDEVAGRSQINRGDGEDTIILFAGETFGCRIVQTGAGHGEAVFIGFGPYILDFPFGFEAFGQGSIVVQDPIAGGYIFFITWSTPNLNIDRLIGLPTTQVSLLDVNGTNQLLVSLGCGSWFS